MKAFIILISLVSSSPIFCQNLIGAWETLRTEEDGTKARGIVIFTGGYQTAAWFDAESGAFIETNGGSWKIENNTVTEIPEYNTKDATTIGAPISFDIEWDGVDKVRIVGKEGWLTRLDAGEPGKLSGAWLISERMRNGDLQPIDIFRPRKTMKILSGTRFQWIAYNTETKQFMGTGGGTYTTKDGKYVEDIEFFSRDNNRVGASLEFNFEIKNDNWHHSGKNSRGEPMYEVWMRRD